MNNTQQTRYHRYVWYYIQETGTNNAVLQTRQFYKDLDGRWYIDLPEYIKAGVGTKGNLQMVAGADTWLDKLSNNTDEVTLTFSNQFFEGCQDQMIQSLIAYGGAAMIELTKDELDTGMWYTTTAGHELWLCPVTKYVFGSNYYPSIIFYSIVKN